MAFNHYPAWYHDSNPSDMKDFVEKYRKKYDGQMPDALGGLGYDAANLLAQSMTKAKSLDGKDIRDAIAGTTNFPGVTGNISIDKNRNASKAAVIVQMAKNDKGEVAPKFVASVAPEKEAPKK
jgi:branched-chain amino acid transport system substrate-binding protein